MSPRAVEICVGQHQGLLYECYSYVCIVMSIQHRMPVPVGCDRALGWPGRYLDTLHYARSIKIGSPKCEHPNVRSESHAF
jgi:hypothetical protein